MAAVQFLDPSYKKNAYLESKIYDLTLNLTQGYTPYSLFRSSNNIDFSYSFGNSLFLKQALQNLLSSLFLYLYHFP
jgi:hypothetical protein